MRVTASVALAAALLVAACGSSTSSPSATVIPTPSGAATTPPTASLAPTASPTPTLGPEPTDIPVPTMTAEPTATASAEPTATGEATATPTAVASASLAPPTDTPGVCAEADLIWDPTLKELLLVNCTTYSGGPTTLTVWGWNGSAWHVVTTGSAPARVVGGAALDTDRGVLTVYGGYVPDVDPCSPETWEWDGTDWSQADVEPPLQCDHHKMIYDPGEGLTLLMGGQDAGGAAVDETWAWDGESWQQFDADLPPSRAHFGLTYDPAHEQLLLYGGLTRAAVLDDFWAFHDGVWEEIDLTGPGTRSHVAIVQDTTANELLLFGGATSSNSYGSLSNDTWLLTGGEWQQLTPETSPTERGSAALGYDPERNQVVLYGGFDASQSELNDTWLWDGETWSCAANCP